MAHGNATKQAHTPNFDRWLANHERSVVTASGEAVGLPEGQMGNSEVGHLNLGAGRVVYQDITRINKAIREGEFGKMPAFSALEKLKKTGGKLHLVGLLGTGGVHSHANHLFALIDLAKEYELDPIIHVITDGRDTPPESGKLFLEALENKLENAGIGTIASVSGRYYTMDRDNRWERIKRGYDVIVNHEGDASLTENAGIALTNSYKNSITDEFINPVIVATDRNVKMEAGDCVVCYNFRSDRMRQFVKALTQPDFDGFARKKIEDLTVLTMTEYDPTFPVTVIFPDDLVSNPLAQVISDHGMSQVHAAETEKYPHVTYFFNGGAETPFPNEDRIMANSPKVATYDLQPEMSAPELTEKLLARLESHDDDFILVNYANPDMVGHTGVLTAAIKAVETVDHMAGKLVNAIIAKGGVAIVTADHGNCEIMVDEKSGNPHTYHTTQPVHLFVLCEEYFWLRPQGILADVAPTVLHLLGIEQPENMTGKSLIE
jgi:2,3-bisphosphoglycerate-independent phosphoglycerate mutase